MKFHQILLGVTATLAACSTPKYVYHFDHYDYNSGRKNAQAVVEKPVASPLVLDETSLVVSSSPQAVIATEKQITSTNSTEAIMTRYQSMSKTEQKAFKKELRKELKSFVKNTSLKKTDGVESVEATQKFDTLITLAIVFGAAGIVLITLAGISNAFWIVGAISLAIGCFFFVKWVANGNG